MVTITVKENNLLLTVKGVGKSLALKSELVIPIQHVMGITADAGAMEMPKGIRAGGTSIPGIIRAGTFLQAGDKVFWDVHNNSKTVVIELTNEEFSRLVVEVKEPEATVSQVEAAINRQ